MRAGVRIGVDVGSARVGVALSDPDAVLATPWSSVPVPAEGSGKDPVTVLVGLVSDRAAMEVIVGLPRSLSGAEGPAAQLAREFSARLAARVRPVSVRLVDERLSTVQAHRSLHASGRPGRRHREVVDQVAAVTILQTALDLERASGRPPGEVVGGRKPRRAREFSRAEKVEGAPR